MKKIVWIIVIILVLLVTAGAVMFGEIYNELATKQEGVNNAWAQAANAYQGRLDLVPGLIMTVRGYAEHEKATLQDVIDARVRIMKINTSPAILSDPNQLARFQDAQTGLTSSLGRLLVVVEQNPDLKASKNFLELQTRLGGAENKITAERRKFNETAKAFNAFRRRVPNFFVADMTGIKNKTYFETDEDVRTAPLVRF